MRMSGNRSARLQGSDKPKSSGLAKHTGPNKPVLNPGATDRSTPKRQVIITPNGLRIFRRMDPNTGLPVTRVQMPDGKIRRAEPEENSLWYETFEPRNKRR